MKLVSRDILKKLIEITTEDESNSDFSFSQCVKIYQSLLNEANDVYIRASIGRGATYVDKFHYAYHKLLNNYLKKHQEAFRFVDAGSSRAAFAMPSGKCLKVAMSAKGVSQNEQEVKNSQSTYKCFPLVYGIDDRNYGIIMVECCAPIHISDTLNDFSLAYGRGVRLIHVIAVLSDIVNQCKCDIKTACKLLAKSVQQNEYFAGNDNDEYGISYGLRLELCEKILHDSSPSFEVLRDVVKFYDEHGKNDNAMLLTDLEFKKNWGLAIRDRKMVPIIIDSGFSEEVCNKHYS